MLRIAIVGCGKIADQHVQAISRVPDCQIVSVCDREFLMARQLGERAGVSHCFSDLGELLKTTSPNVVHITTPPQSHYLLARQCLESGSHVYLEKPFTVTASEAKTLLQLAETRGLKITAGHNYQFTPEMLEMRRLIEQGFLGGKPVHLESYYSYDLGDATYVAPLLGNRSHWVRQLPGQLLHNVISHGIARLAEFLDDGLVEITASAHQSDRLRNLGGEEVLDELRVMIRDKSGTTAFFCFSTQIQPGLSEFRVCGPLNSILVDQVAGSLIRNQKRACKSYLTFFLPPLWSAMEHLRNGRRNILNFLGRKLYQDSGMTELVRRFYQSIRDGTPLPIPHREILLTARVMDEIFSRIYSGSEVAEKEQTEFSVV
ncbi:MAG: Gfo/Idh/MocA family oxidoreductase [Verrucomicrobia bacterium]|nr:Gfo/Idh/MocA family oxidoreductase [Verrucomicrobiota bacterium]MBV8273909.1 Gfo/Idh/MocA family oxidoreductase [Verrucomicrobiota bacterium]